MTLKDETITKLQILLPIIVVMTKMGHRIEQLQDHLSMALDYEDLVDGGLEDLESSLSSNKKLLQELQDTRYHYRDMSHKLKMVDEYSDSIKKCLNEYNEYIKELELK